MLRFLSILLWIQAAFVCSSFAETRTVLGKGTSTLRLENGKPWFSLQFSRLDPPPSTNEARYESVYLDSENQILSKEDFTVLPRSQFTIYRWEQRQTGERASVERVQNELRLTYQERKDRPTQAEVIRISKDDPTPVIVPPMLPEFIMDHWDDVKPGKSLDLKLIVPDRMDVFSFKLTLEKNKNPDQVEWTLKPSSLFVKIVAGTIHFRFRKDKTLLEMKDFQPPLKIKDSKGHLSTSKTDILFVTPK